MREPTRAAELGQQWPLISGTTNACFGRLKSTGGGGERAARGWRGRQSVAYGVETGAVGAVLETQVAVSGAGRNESSVRGQLLGAPTRNRRAVARLPSARIVQGGVRRPGWPGAPPELRASEDGIKGRSCSRGRCSGVHRPAHAMAGVARKARTRKAGKEGGSAQRGTMGGKAVGLRRLRLRWSKTPTPSLLPGPRGLPDAGPC